MTALAASAAAFCLAAAALQGASLALVAIRLRRRESAAAPAQNPAVSLLRPVCGLENKFELAIGSSFALDYPDFELLFCVESPQDAAIGPLRRAIAAHPKVEARILVGPCDLSRNPKLNNLVKGWRAARHVWIAMADSNVALPPDYLQRLLARWTPRTGLVSSPPFGDQPENFWAQLECAFLNTYQARWQLAADELGLGFAQGKTLFWRRDILEAAGGIEALAREAAEDAAATKIVHAAGLKVRLARAPFAQPLGRRGLAEVWARQLRWARLRRATFPAFFAPELLAGGFFPLGAAWALAASGHWPVAVALGLTIAWYGGELALAGLARWPLGLASLPALLARDLTLPALWACAWAGDGFVWRGNAMQAAPSTPAPGG